MPFSFAIDPARRLVTVRLYGVLTRDDITTGRREMARHPDFRPDLDQILDLRDVERVDVDAAGLRELAGTAPFGVGSRRAMVAPTDVLFGLSRLYEIAGSSRQWEMQVFHTLDEARRWLEEERAGDVTG